MDWTQKAIDDFNNYNSNLLPWMRQNDLLFSVTDEEDKNMTTFLYKHTPFGNPDLDYHSTLPSIDWIDRNMKKVLDEQDHKLIFKYMEWTGPLEQSLEYWQQLFTENQYSNNTPPIIVYNIIKQFIEENPRQNITFTEYVIDIAQLLLDNDLINTKLFDGIRQVLKSYYEQEKTPSQKSLENCDTTQMERIIKRTEINADKKFHTIMKINLTKFLRKIDKMKNKFIAQRSRDKLNNPSSRKRLRNDDDDDKVDTVGDNDDDIKNTSSKNGSQNKRFRKR